MQLAHLLGSNRGILWRDFDARSHGSGSPFVVVGFARLCFKPSPLILFLPRLGQGSSGRLDNPSLVHLGQSGNDHSASRDFQKFVFAVQQLAKMCVVDEDLIV